MKRNPRLFEGQYITITRWNDGSPLANFKRMVMCPEFNIDCFATGVRNELRRTLNGLVDMCKKCLPSGIVRRNTINKGLYNVHQVVNISKDIVRT